MQKARTKFKQVYQRSRDGANSYERHLPYLIYHTGSVLELSKKYGIKFVCGKEKANERRRKDRLKQSQASAENYGVNSGQQATLQPKARDRRDKSTDRDSAKRIDDIYSSALPRAEKYELLYAEAWRSFEQKMIDLKMRPAFPEKKRYTPENASNSAIRKAERAVCP